MKTDAVIKQEGITALISRLGYADAERFIVLMTKEPFDYTKWREQYFDEGLSVRELSKRAMYYVVHGYGRVNLKLVGQS